MPNLCFRLSVFSFSFLNAFLTMFFGLSIETSFSSVFPFDVATTTKYRFITTTSTQGTQSNFRELTIMVKGSNASTIEYGIYLINLSPTNIANGSGLMDAKLFSETLITSASGIVIDSYDFSAEAR